MRKEVLVDMDEDEVKTIIGDLELLLELQRFYIYGSEYKTHKKRIKKLIKKMKKKLKKGGDYN